MGKMSRTKGKVGEREIAKILREHGYKDARRGQQYCGSAGDADVTGLPGFHLEVKRVERLNLTAAMSQSISDAKPGEVPLVVHRQSRQPWKVTMLFDDFLKLVKEGGSDN